MRGIISEHWATHPEQIQLREQEIPGRGIPKSIDFICRKNAPSNIHEGSNIGDMAQPFKEAIMSPERDATHSDIRIGSESERCSKEAVPCVRHDPSKEDTGRVPGHDEHEHGRSESINYEPHGAQCRQVRTRDGGDDCVIYCI